MHHKSRRQFHPSFLEQLEIRTMLDCSGALAGDLTIEFEKSEYVTENPDGTLRFASLNVGAVPDSLNFGQSVILSDDATVEIRGSDFRIGQVKSFLHGFADSIGTDHFIETSDYRVSPWGTGSGSTTNRFEDFITAHVEAAETCTGLRFDGDVRFELPGEGGELFTGGFLELRQDGVSTLLRSGDIAEVVERYEITFDGKATTLTVTTTLGDMEFTINEDQTLTDAFQRIWQSDSEYEIVDPDAVDRVLGDIDGDGMVGFQDFLILAGDFGTNSDASDLNEDGKVDLADFLVLSNHFGTSSE